MSYRADKLVIDGHTHAGNDNTRRPKLASGKKAEISIEVIMRIFNAIIRNYIYQIQFNWNINQGFPTQF